MDPCIKLDKIDIESGMYFPIQKIVSVTLKHSCCTQIVSNSEMAMLLKGLWLSI